MYNKIAPPPGATWGICLKRRGEYWIAFQTAAAIEVRYGVKEPLVEQTLPASPAIMKTLIKQREDKWFKMVAEWNPTELWVPRQPPSQPHSSPATGGGKYGKHGQLPTPPPNRPVPPPPPPKPMSIIDIVRAWQEEVPPEEEWF